MLSDSHRRQGRGCIFHLFIAYHYDGELSELWIDLEFILSQPGGQDIFRGSRPGKGGNFLRCLRRSIVATPAVEENSEPMGGSASSGNSLHNFLRLSRLLANRVFLDGEDAWNLTTQHLRLLLTDLAADSEGTPPSFKPVQDAQGLVINHTLSYRDDEYGIRIPFKRMLEFFEAWFDRELDILNFDWAALENQVWKLAGRLRQELGNARLDAASKCVSDDLALHHDCSMLPEVVESALEALQANRDGTASSSELKTVEATAQVLSAFATEHASDGVDALRQKHYSQEAEADK